MAEQIARARELVDSARAAEQHGNTARALSLYDDALAQFDQSSTDPLLADTLRWKGTLLRERGETDSAHKCYLSSLGLAERCGLVGGQAHALNCLAIIAQRRGDLKETEALYSRAADLAVQTGDARLLGMIEQNRGVLANMRGDLDDAELLYSRSLSAFEGANDQEAISWVLNNLGKLYTQRGDHDKARTHIERALAIAGDGDATVESILTLNLAEVFIGAGQLELADDACRRAFDKAQRRGDHLTAAGALKCRAHVERERGALDKSMATLRIAIFESQGTQDRLLQAELLRELGEISRALGNASAAKAAWREAAQAYEGAGARGDAAEIESRISDLGTPS